MPLRQAPVGLFSPLTAAEIVELDTVINPPVSVPPYAPLRVQVAPDNLGRGGRVTTRDEVLVMTGFGGPGYAGVPGNPIPSGPWWIPTVYAVNKYLRLLCERVNSLCPRPTNGANDMLYCAFIEAELWAPLVGAYSAQTIRDPAARDVLTQTVYIVRKLFMFFTVIHISLFTKFKANLLFSSNTYIALLVCLRILISCLVKNSPQ